jgi:phosphoglycolate phosphatase
VIFDLDGTVVDTPDVISTTMSAVLSRSGVAVRPQDVRPTIGKPLLASIAYLLGLPAGDGRVAAAAAAYRERFDAQMTERGSDLLFPGVTAGLETLRGHGIALAIATSKVLAVARLVLGETGIAGLFDVVVGHDDVPDGKPAPDMALLAARRLGVAPARCVVVGDAVGDVLMGVAAGMPVLGVSYGIGAADELLAAGAGRIAGDFPAVVREVLARAGA